MWRYCVAEADVILAAFGPFDSSAMKSRHTLTSGAPAADTALSRGLLTPE